jgi:hypothetical protein
VILHRRLDRAYLVMLLVHQAVEKKPNIGDDVREEVCITLELLRPLSRPSQPTVNGTYTVQMKLLMVCALSVAAAVGNSFVITRYEKRLLEIFRCYTKFIT